jgi:hypothetical protein
VISAIDDPHEALAHAVAQAGEGGSVLVTGSLYLLEDLHDVLEYQGETQGGWGSGDQNEAQGGRGSGDQGET